MDYKKIIKNRQLRLKILELLSFVPDKLMLQFQYALKTGRKLNWKNPLRYTEKIQWYKIYYRTPLMVKCADKYDVREYVESKGLENILNPCYGIYDSVEDIDWSKLPEQFVMKDTLGGGGTSVEIVRNKSEEDLNRLRKIGNSWTAIKAHVKSGGREWPYYSGKNHRIIIEKFVDSDPLKGGLIDYKFLCFNGKAVLLYIMADRVTGQGAGCGFFDLEFAQLSITESDEETLKRKITKPRNFHEMIKVAEKLAEDFPCARIDLYNEDENIIFGEITFYDSSGYMVFDPDSFDYELGSKFKLPKMKREL